MSNFENALKALFILAVLLLGCMLFMVSPRLGYFFSIPTLIFFGFYSKHKPPSVIKNITSLLIFMVLVSIAFHNVSYENFILESDDFTDYYNNYLGFLNEGFTLFYLFRFGPEINLALFNFILSELINGPYPYLLKFIYSLLQVFLLYLVIRKIRLKEELNFFSYIILFSLVIIFFKSNLLIQYSRQAFSSMLILLAVFSTGKDKKLYLVIALLTHLSAFIVYPLCKILMTEMSKKLFIRALFISFLIFIFLLSSSYISGYVSGIPLLNKLVYVTKNMNNTESVITSIKSSMMLVLYMMPIFFYSIVTSFRMQNQGFQYNVYLIVFIIILFSAFPGFINRVFLPVISVFLGYFYYKILFINSFRYKDLAIRLTAVLLFHVIIFFASSFSGGAYSRYSIIDLNFNHITDTLFFKQQYIDRRFLL